MSYAAESAQRYRLRAAHLRTIAKGELVIETRRALLGIADSYEQMAESLETIDATVVERQHNKAAVSVAIGRD